MILPCLKLKTNNTSTHEKKPYFIFGIFLCAIGVSFTIPTLPPNLEKILFAPSTQHWLGTDLLGHDIFNRLLVGMRYSIVISLVTVCMAAICGTIISLWIITNKSLAICVQIIVNMCIAIPPFIVCLLLITHFSGGTLPLILGQVLAFLPVFIRLSYHELKQVMQSEYAQTSIGLGNTLFAVAKNHGLPILLPKIKAQMISLLAVAIGIESGLSYLGLGPPLPQAGLGQILHESIGYWSSAPWYPIATMLSFFILLGTIASMLDREL